MVSTKGHLPRPPHLSRFALQVFCFPGVLFSGCSVLRVPRFSGCHAFPGALLFWMPCSGQEFLLRRLRQAGISARRKGPEGKENGRLSVGLAAPDFPAVLAKRRRNRQMGDSEIRKCVTADLPPYPFSRQEWVLGDSEWVTAVLSPTWVTAKSAKIGEWVTAGAEGQNTGSTMGKISTSVIEVQVFVLPGTLRKMWRCPARKLPGKRGRSATGSLACRRGGPGPATGWVARKGFAFIAITGAFSTAGAFSCNDSLPRLATLRLSTIRLSIICLSTLCSGLKCPQAETLSGRNALR
ncbi:hypothetical protein GGP93_003284 [Salinibacter ruber]|nr:hypothetical protein [Salinibacter ruber]